MANPVTAWWCAFCAVGLMALGAVGCSPQASRSGGSTLPAGGPEDGPPHRPVEEVPIRIPLDGERVPHLAGSLYLPADGGVRPGVVLVQGSGPSDRYWDNKYVPGTIGTGRVLAEHLAGEGLVVLAYDKRGVGKSPIDPQPNTGELAGDLDAAFAFLRTHEATQGCGVGVVGHSQGAGLAAELGAARDDVAAVVLLSGAGRSTRSIVREQVRNNVLAPAGVSASEMDASLAYLDASLTQIAAGEAPSPPPDNVHPSIQGLVQAFAENASGESVDEEPAARAGAVRVPLLIVGGGKDRQITRADFDALAAAAPHATTRFVEDMDHVLKVETRDVSAASGEQIVRWYGEDRPVHPQLLRETTRFLRQALPCSNASASKP